MDFRPVLRLGTALLALMCLASCNRPCPKQSAVTGLDGGAFPCVQSTDCPRPSGVLVCGQPEDELRGCVGCEQNRCVEYVLGACP